jgi:hypothetical protein
LLSILAGIMFPASALLPLGCTMSPELVDQTILTYCKPQFRKVIFIIGQAERDLKDVKVDFIADRIKALVKAEKLEAAGNLEWWERSEIRLTGK